MSDVFNGIFTLLRKSRCIIFSGNWNIDAVKLKLEPSAIGIIDSAILRQRALERIAMFKSVKDIAFYSSETHEFMFMLYPLVTRSSLCVVVPKMIRLGEAYASRFNFIIAGGTISGISCSSEKVSRFYLGDFNVLGRAMRLDEHEIGKMKESKECHLSQALKVAMGINYAGTPMVAVPYVWEKKYWDKDNPPVAFVMPVGSGKSYYSKKLGGIDIDTCRSKKLEDELKPLQLAKKWKEHNDIWFTYTKDFYGDLKGKIIFLHSVDHAKFLGIEDKDIYIAKLSWLLTEKGIIKREDEKNKDFMIDIARQNWNGTKTANIYSSYLDMEMHIYDIMCKYEFGVEEYDEERKKYVRVKYIVRGSQPYSITLLDGVAWARYGEYVNRHDNIPVEYSTANPYMNFMILVYKEFPYEERAQTWLNSQSHLVRMVSMMFKDKYDLSDTKLKEMRYEAVVKTGVKVMPLYNYTDVTGVIVGTTKVIDVSGHLVNLLFAASYNLVDLLRILESIKWNATATSGEKRTLRMKGILAESGGYDDGYWHSYMDWIYAIDAYYYVAETLSIPYSYEVGKYVKMYLEGLRDKLPEYGGTLRAMNALKQVTMTGGDIVASELK